MRRRQGVKTIRKLQPLHELENLLTDEILKNNLERSGYIIPDSYLSDNTDIHIAAGSKIIVDTSKNGVVN
tara:strand:+ start:655 stop:864 length:210 start_codon:yes stop_codon:yes gene_type:complete